MRSSAQFHKYKADRKLGMRQPVFGKLLLKSDSDNVIYTPHRCMKCSPSKITKQPTEWTIWNAFHHFEK